MHFEANQLYHIYNRGNNHATIFFERDNYLYFLNKMRKELLPYCHILAWCLMPNHFHWMVYTKEEGIYSRSGQASLSGQTSSNKGSGHAVLNDQTTHTSTSQTTQPLKIHWKIAQLVHPSHE